MPQISFRRSHVLALTALMIVSASNARAERSRVDIRLYDAGGGTLEMRSAAIRTAAAILDEAGVVATWHDCTTDGRRPACRNSRRTGNLIVRILPAFTVGASNRGTALASRTNDADPDVRLGVAIVDPKTRAGELATLFHEQVLAVAQRAGIDSSELLGRALAHEIGHLLLGAPGHSSTGLMRAVWTDAELTGNRRDDWRFAPSDRRRLRGR
jgi:hypothetical protein